MPLRVFATRYLLEKCRFTNSNTMFTVITKVISGQRPLPPKPDSKAYQSGLTDWMWSLIEECWDQNPTKRPMISDVVDRLSSREEFLRHGDKDHESWGRP
ncbi:hypothetical protein BDQ17DRAFT_266751 [Cyathus striatus]|nr:hypothetical protein BDQ17DRAFT_266751 [Cyathus striatus]